MEAAIDLSELLFSRLGFTQGECAGKVIVITGAGQGIGREVARTFALLDGKVVIAELSPKTGMETETAIRAEKGQAFFIQTDVASPESVQNLMRAVHSKLGTVDILVNNAIRCPVVAVVDMGFDQWDEVLDVNLKGTFLVSKAFLPEMLEKHQGVIVNMVSTDAMPGLSAYIASKQGILGFSQTLALETGQSGVKVIPFGPGMVNTPGIRGVAGSLAPMLGMNEQQFLHLSLHSAYDGLMPVEHASAATAYLALRLADEFHGMMVNGYEILERAGLIRSTLVPDSALQGFDRVSLIKQVEELIATIKETGQEFEKLPFFVRPMARGGFKNKSGMDLQGWQLSLEMLRKSLEAGKKVEMPSMEKGFDGLIDYYRGVPAETARFTKDQEMLKMVAELSAKRVKLIQQLKDILESINT